MRRQLTDLEMGPRPRDLALEMPTRVSAISAPANRMMNNPTGEPWGACQSEVSIAAQDSDLVATWNDGIGIYGPPTSTTDDTQGFA